MSKSKLTFDPGTLSQLAAVAAMEDEDFLQETIQLNKRGLKSFQEAFAKQGWKISPSVANFSMIDCGIEDNAIQLTNDLEKRGIIVRRLGGFRLPHCIRISTGTDDTNQRVILTMQELIAHYA